MRMTSGPILEERPPCIGNEGDNMTITPLLDHAQLVALLLVEPHGHRALVTGELT